MTQRYTVNRPVTFTGSEAERQANRASHDWIRYDHEEPRECAVCCCKETGQVANWPCGKEQRETIEVEVEDLETAER